MLKERTRKVLSFLSVTGMSQTLGESPKGRSANEPDSDSQGLNREEQARRRDSEIVA